MGVREWFIHVLWAFVFLLIIVFVRDYRYLLSHDRDALRSEKYPIQKLAIKHGHVGDSEIGTIDMDATKDVKLLARKSEKNGDRS